MKTIIKWGRGELTFNGGNTKLVGEVYWQRVSPGEENEQNFSWW